MGKVVTTVLIVAVAVAVVVFAPQIAAAIGASGIFGATVTAATLATITSSLVGLGVSLGLAAVASVFRKVPNMSQSLVDRLNTSVVPSAPRKIIIGTTAAGADVRFLENFDRPGSKKDGFAQIVALASHRINAVKQFYLEETLTWNGSTIVDDHDGGVLAIRACLEGKANNGFAWGSGSYWTAQHTFTGCAYLATRFKLDSKAWPSGIPSRYTTIVEGCPLYDPRRDSTNGGSGAHRIVDQSTWTFREGSTEIGRNPALAMLVYLLGYRINGKLAWGMGIPAHRIDFDNFRAYANLGEERVLTQSGGTVQRYTADGSFSTADTHETVISGITAAMGSCKLVDTGGLYQLVGGYDDTIGPKVDFDEHDIVAAAGSASPYTWKPAPATRETYNIARGRFADPANLYQLVDWGVVETDPLADGIPRTMSLDLGLVSRAETCQRIAKQFLLREALAPGVFSATFGPKAFAVQVGSLLTLSLPERGWNRKLFRVQEQVETHDLFFSMVLREESADIYAWDREEKPLPANIRPSSYDPRDTVAPANLAVTSDVITGAGGQQVSEVEVTWTPADSARVAGIQIESRPVGAVAWTEQAALHDPVAGVFRFTSNVGGTDLAVRARYRMDTGVYSDWVGADVISAAIEVIDGKARDDASIAVDTAQQAQETANAAAGATATLNAKFDQMAANVVDANAAIDDLVENYGSTATAAASATAAQIAASAAQASADTSQTASDNAATAKSAAEQAENDAVAAKTAAETARSQAQTAATSAGTASTNAQAAKTAAETARTLAQAAKTDAETAFVNSTTAKTAAEAAKTAAETARTNAQAAATGANNSATAAAGSASTASTKATEAGNSATAASASAVSATLVAAAQMPSDFQQDGEFWQNGFGGLPGSLTPISANSTFSFQNVSGVGRVMQISASAQIDIGNIGMIPLTPGRRYRLTTSIRQISGTVGQQVQHYRIGVTSVGGTVANSNIRTLTLATLDQWYDATAEFDGDVIMSAGGVAVRSFTRFLATSATTVCQIAYIRLEDITESTSAAGSASAAATSAAAAAVSQTSAGSSASAAQSSATSAGTSAGQASTSATNAATSETNAKGAENAAKTSQTASAASATNAGNSATAASNSASTASTKATEASQSASTATTQANTATTKAGQASTSATNAASSASDAAGSRNAAATSATNAATSATNAGNSATAASNSASTATTQATNAGNAATSAATSAVSANSTYNSALAALYVASPILPSSFDEGAKHWTSQRTGNPVNLADIVGTALIDPDMGPSLEISNFTTAGQNIMTKGVIAPKAGRIYEVSTTFKIMSSDGSVSFNFALGNMASGYGAASTSLTTTLGQTFTTTGVANVMTRLFSLDTISGAAKIPADAALFRAGLRLNGNESGLVFRVGEIRITDVTEREAALSSANGAAASASAASTSASNAATNATNAGTSATSANNSATTASTKAGEASTSASRAASSETNANASKNAASTSATNAANSATAAGGSASAANGSASNAQTSATNAGNSAATASAQALYASSHAAGNLIRKGVFSDGSIGDWTGSVSAITTSFTPPDGSTRVLQSKNRDSYEGALSPWAFTTERKLRLTGYLLAFGAYGGRIGVQIQNASGTNSWQLSTTTPSNTSSWTFVDMVATIPAQTASIRFVIVSEGAYGASDHDLRATGLSVTDVTDSTAAAGSASAAASSASAAGTSATNAGNSANSATQSANTASTKANEASNSASSAANSASSASSASTNAGNSATAANSSDVSATLSAASQMPSDFQQDGKFWRQGFGGLPADANPITANSTFSFVDNSDVGRSMRVTATSQIDVGNVGMLPLQADRTYRITAKVRQQTGSVFARLQLYRIGVTDNGGTTGNGTVANPATHTFTALNQWVELTGTVSTSTTNAMIASGASSIRCLLRLLAASSTVTVDYSFIRIEDITESTDAAGSANAAASSASKASASQSAAGSSASSAQSSATNAATSAGQASTSATNASTSANNAAGSANTASTQATNAANSAGAAAGSASAASGSASTASTKATEAGNSAASAASSSIAASASAASTLPSDFLNQGEFFRSNQYLSSPANGSQIVPDATHSFPSVAGVGTVMQVVRTASTGTIHISPRGWVKIVQGRTYRIRTRVRSTSTAGSIFLFAIGISEASQQVSALGISQSSMAANQWYDVEYISTAETLIAAGSAYLRPLLRLDSNNTFQAAYLAVDDITESTAATGSANAAANSASQASASQSGAGSSASSAQSSANTAATQANNAKNSATAAAGSASSASTSSSNAGSSATSATNSANTASTKAGEASSSASAAAGSASTASSAASTATTQANLTAQYSTGGGNMLTNTDFAVDTSGWAFYNSSQTANGGRNIAGDQWRILNENSIGIQQPNTSNAGYSEWAQYVSVVAGNWYDVSAMAVAHRCQVIVYLHWFNASGTALSAPSSGLMTTASGGGTRADWTQIGFKAQAPAGAVQARMILRKMATISGQSPDSYAWFARPQVRETFSTAPTPCAYSPGNGGAVAATQQAAISSTQTALATANASIATINTNVSTLNSSVNVQQTAINNLNGKTAAYWQVAAVSGGRAQLTVYADSNGGGGVDIVGDLRVTGNALISGTVNPEALALGRFVKRIGPVSISPTNSTGTIYSAALGETMGNGSYLLEGTVGFTYSSGRSTTTYNGRPLYTDYANDGGVNILLKKNGNIIASTGWSGNLLTNYGSLAYGSAMTTVFDAPAADTYTGHVTVEVTAFKGGTDTGIINQGDYYTRTISGSYSNFSFSNLRLKWTFI